MTCNIRYDSAAPPGHPDCWTDRAPLLSELLRTARPTLLGVQEALFPQLAVVGDALPGHRLVGGMGRLGGSRSEHNPVLYDPERLTLEGWDQQWLSETPYAIGSDTRGGGCPRMLLRCDFIDQKTGRPLTIINTHLDNASDHARLKGAEQIAALAASIEHPVVVTGDFNCATGSAPWLALTDVGLRDCWDSAAEQGSGSVATYHGYHRPGPGDRIDWILTSEALDVRSVKINTWTHDGRWPSDHWPVQAEMEWR